MQVFTLTTSESLGELIIVFQRCLSRLAYLISSSLALVSYPGILIWVLVLETSYLVKCYLFVIMSKLFKMVSVVFSARSFLKVSLKSFIGLSPLLCIVPQLLCCNQAELFDHFKIYRCKNQRVYPEILRLYYTVKTLHLIAVSRVRIFKKHS